MNKSAKAENPNPTTAPGTFFPLWSGGSPQLLGTKDSDIPGLYLYPLILQSSPQTMILVLPGGGYRGLALEHEGKKVAEWLNSQGVSAAVLRYRHAPKYLHPYPLNDALRAMKLLRAHAQEWNVNEKRVGVLGFSAGGHLASTLGTESEEHRQTENDPVEDQRAKPDFLILVYPVISFHPPDTHADTVNNLLGSNPDPELLNRLSTDTRVNADTPPTFLAHTEEDTTVSAKNSILFYLALLKNKVPGELHIYDKGSHGMGMGTAELSFSAWPNAALNWLRSIKMLDPDMKITR